jgi:hypothetical protein
MIHQFEVTFRFNSWILGCWDVWRFVHASYGEVARGRSLESLTGFFAKQQIRGLKC